MLWARLRKCLRSPSDRGSFVAEGGGCETSASSRIHFLLCLCQRWRSDLSHVTRRMSQTFNQPTRRHAEVTCFDVSTSSCIINLKPPAKDPNPSFGSIVELDPFVPTESSQRVAEEWRFQGSVGSAGSRNGILGRWSLHIDKGAGALEGLKGRQPVVLHVLWRPFRCAPLNS